ncbi:hypothetical protein HaLaN_13708 [Haematococcus lacustris]|uniref:Uncharacterized protein n=1 Tax=Haematococcus lacustris TaxID=44745 RepID=A0A699ZE34_HAELA|nr:hypothetical protein HaLaN_13708 [Haematococcus lacustris]
MSTAPPGAMGPPSHAGGQGRRKVSDLFRTSHSRLIRTCNCALNPSSSSLIHIDIASPPIVISHQGHATFEGAPLLRAASLWGEVPNP